MNRVNLINQDNQNIEVEIVRYFKNMNNNYIIYSMNEVDESNYAKLYAGKVVGQEIVNVDENEWNTVKDLIKEIVKESKIGTVTVIEDLDYNSLNQIRVTSNRAFKLPKAFVDDLGKNKKEFNGVQPETPINVTNDLINKEPQVGEINNTVASANNYEALYLSEQEKNADLTKQISKLNAELAFYKNKLDNIKSILDRE